MEFAFAAKCLLTLNSRGAGFSTGGVLGHIILHRWVNTEKII